MNANENKPPTKLKSNSLSENGQSLTVKNVAGFPYLDKSNSHFLSHLLTATEVYISDFIKSTDRLRNEFATSLWFANLLKEYNIVDYLSYAQKGYELPTLTALLYAFSHPGTKDSLLKLCKAIFGLNSAITIDDSVAGVITLTIQGSSRQFISGLVTMDDRAVTTSVDSWVTLNVYTSLGNTNLLMFLIPFIPAGYTLKLVSL